MWLPADRHRDAKRLGRGKVGPPPGSSPETPDVKGEGRRTLHLLVTCLPDAVRRTANVGADFDLLPVDEVPGLANDAGTV